MSDERLLFVKSLESEFQKKNKLERELKAYKEAE